MAIWAAGPQTFLLVADKKAQAIYKYEIFVDGDSGNGDGLRAEPANGGKPIQENVVTKAMAVDAIRGILFVAVTAQAELSLVDGVTGQAYKLAQDASGIVALDLRRKQPGTEFAE